MSGPGSTSPVASTGQTVSPQQLKNYKAALDKKLEEIQEQAGQTIKESFSDLISRAQDPATDPNALRYEAISLQADLIGFLKGQDNQFVYEKKEQVDMAEFIQKLKKLKTLLIKVLDHRFKKFKQEIQGCQNVNDIHQTIANVKTFITGFKEVLGKERKLPVQPAIVVSKPAQPAPLEPKPEITPVPVSEPKPEPKPAPAPKPKKLTAREKADALFEQGLSTFGQGNYKKALKFFNKAEAAYKSVLHTPEYQDHQARCYEKMGNIKKALKLYQGIKKKYPDYASAMVALRINQLDAQILDHPDKVWDALADYLPKQINRIGHKSTWEASGKVEFYVSVTPSGAILLGTSKSGDWIHFGEDFQVVRAKDGVPLSRKTGEQYLVQALIDYIFKANTLSLGKVEIKKPLYFNVRIREVSAGNSQVMMTSSSKKEVKALKAGIKFTEIGSKTKIYKYNVMPSAKKELAGINKQLMKKMGLDKKKLSKEEKKTKALAADLLVLIHGDAKYAALLEPQNLSVGLELISYLFAKHRDSLSEAVKTQDAGKLRELIDWNFKYAYDSVCDKIFKMWASAKTLEGVEKNHEKYLGIKKLRSEFKMAAKNLNLTIYEPSYDDIPIAKIMKQREHEFAWLIPNHRAKEKLAAIRKISDNDEKLRELGAAMDQLVDDILTIHDLGENVKFFVGKYHKLYELINSIKVTKENLETFKAITKKVKHETFKDIRELLEKKLQGTE